jgi:aspartyl-tRNA(Asn)/glutamyl-tRNA(Gln) amidotransferase subunit C
MDIRDVENLAELAKIELSQEEKENILGDMGGILEYIKVIEQVELEEAEPVYDIKNVWREDTVEKREFRADLLTGQFPDSQDGFLKVKKIL